MKYQQVRRMGGGRAAQKNRKNLNRIPTKSERLLAEALDRAGIQYTQNFTVRTADSFSGYYLVDFYLPTHKLFIEVDGGVHKSETAQWKDRLRTEAILRKHPHAKLLRVWNSDVDRNPDAALAKLLIT